MPRGVAIAAAVAAALALPATANAAGVGVRPIKSCYRSGETVLFAGFGFTPNSAVDGTADGSPIGTLTTDDRGVFGGSLHIGLASGERRKTYAATDQTDPTISASTTIRVSAVDVGVRPLRGRPGRRIRIRARGFTTGSRLYAHVRRGRFHRSLRIGRLHGACHTLSTRRRLFSRHTRPGVYLVQFDTKRRYSSATRTNVRYSFTVFQTVG